MLLMRYMGMATGIVLKGNRMRVAMAGLKTSAETGKC